MKQYFQHSEKKSIFLFRSQSSYTKRDKHIFIYEYTLKEYISKVPYFKSYWRSTSLIEGKPRRNGNQDTTLEGVEGIFQNENKEQSPGTAVPQAWKCRNYIKGVL